MPTRTIYLFDDLGNKVAVGTYEPAPVSLTVGGSWTNTQYTGSAPDPTGLTFTCTFSDGTSSSVVPTSVSPSTWSSTVGTQTATFSYTAGGVTVSDSKSVNVELDGGYTVTISPAYTNAIAFSSDTGITLTRIDGTSFNTTYSGDLLELGSINNIVSICVENISGVETPPTLEPSANYTLEYTHGGKLQRWNYTLSGNVTITQLH